MNTTQKRIGIATAIAMVFLIAAVGSASAVTMINSCNFNANTEGEYYVLGQNLTCNGAEHGIIVGANNVVIDGYNATDGKYYWMDGNVADCAGANRWSGIYDRADALEQNIVNVTIKNLEIKHFCNGIYTRSDPPDCTCIHYNWTIQNCKIHDSGEQSTACITTHGLKLECFYNSTIEKNDICNTSGGTGCSMGCENGGNGIFIKIGNYNDIKCNRIYNNSKAGIFTKGGPEYYTITYNNLFDNRGNGGEGGGIVLRCKRCKHFLIAYNNASNNADHGIFIGGPNNTIKHNTAVNNDYGICLCRYEVAAGDGSESNTVTDNTACGNSVNDTKVVNEPGNVCNNNTCGDCFCEGAGCANCCPNGGGACDYTCANLVPVYYDFDKDDDCSQATCTCSICGGRGTCACCNPGLFNSSGAGQHCIGVCNTSTGNDPDDCNASVYGDPKIPPLSELPGPTPTPTPTPPAGEKVTVSATVGIAPPEVICKCETPDDDPIEEGTQVRPNLWPDIKTVMKCAIACDPNGIGDIKYVNATTYYPNGTVKETQTMHVANESEKAACCCDTTGLPNETCQVYAGYITMEACDPAGDYTVMVTATDNGGANGELSNQFEYLSIIGLDLDLNAVGFGTVAPGETKIVPGDDVWGAPNLTVHSIGNDPIDIGVSATDMTSDGNVITKDSIDCEIDALGTQWLNVTRTFDINLECCSYENIDLSLHVPEGTVQGAYTGTVTFVAKHA